MTLIRVSIFGFMTMKGALIIAVIALLEISSFAVGNCDGSGNCYVSNIATGTGTGADWTNACTDFKGPCDVSSSSMRGTTIWVGGSPGNPVGPSYTTTAFPALDSGTLRPSSTDESLSYPLFIRHYRIGSCSITSGDPGVRLRYPPGVSRRLVLLTRYDDI